MASVTLFTSGTGGRPTPRPVPDWMRCINCKEFAKHGAITHLRGCPEYVRARPRRVRIEEG